jgi:hypothetical protein
VLFLTFLSLKNNVNVPSTSNKQKNCVKKLVFCWHLEGQYENNKIRNQDPDLNLDPLVRHGSDNPDPDPHQKVMDPQHCLSQLFRARIKPSISELEALWVWELSYLPLFFIYIFELSSPY